jgi:polysaccharide export outer membrane protein
MHKTMYTRIPKSNRPSRLPTGTGLSFALVLVLLFGLATPALAQAQGSADTYSLGPGDQIIISVFGEDDLSMDVRLGDSGTLNYPLLGTLQVEGLTVNQLEELIADGLKGDYLVDPDVTVSMKEYRRFYLNGEVRKPGGYPYEPGLTLEKAIALAGGFTEFASKKKIEVKRSAGEAEQSVRIRLTDAVYPGDVITVPEGGLF